MFVCTERNVVLLMRNKFCFWLRKCIDARDVEAAIKADSRRTSARLNRLENVSKSQTSAEWKESRTTATECLVWYVWSQFFMRFRRLSEWVSYSAVCLEVVKGRDMVRELTCLHIYHRECLYRWYTSWQVNCPLYQRDFSGNAPQPPRPVHTVRSEEADIR